ncbi:hypothetical protein L209DRAFT_415822 [Thermothelomyces heterothallicus CBS 203.75]
MLLFSFFFFNYFSPAAEGTQESFLPFLTTGFTRAVATGRLAQEPRVCPIIRTPQTLQVLNSSGRERQQIDQPPINCGTLRNTNVHAYIHTYIRITYVRSI